MLLCCVDGQSPHANISGHDNAHQFRVSNMWYYQECQKTQLLRSWRFLFRKLRGYLVTQILSTRGTRASRFAKHGRARQRSASSKFLSSKTAVNLLMMAAMILTPKQPHMFISTATNLSISATTPIQSTSIYHSKWLPRHSARQPTRQYQTLVVSTRPHISSVRTWRTFLQNNHRDNHRSYPPFSQHVNTNASYPITQSSYYYHPC